ncbi:SCP2 sterol-binding domain-containing protein [Pseudomonas sp. MH2]|uniref:Ubiquinone biosynthesis accessory factor UbiT n=1 Tax=Pseudomonas machongensis TaxID=3110229 RepID=A0ABU5VGD9_9PSED|nr:SCP2 sterol-binding domain-containing protein [Pseudomonas sp. MH2]MEA5672439.1 SCP2 sterol-binding domain-containing protein [Pseudomonas sp. MH2]
MRRLQVYGERLLKLGQHVPFVWQKLAIEQLSARLFAEPLREGAFELLRGHWLRLHVSDLGLSWCVTCQGARLKVVARSTADVTIRGNWREFLLLASRQEDPDTLFFRRRLVIEGDTELGLGVKNLLDALDPEQMPPSVWRVMRRMGEAIKN